MKLLNVYVLGLIIVQGLNYMIWVGIKKSQNCALLIMSFYTDKYLFPDYSFSMSVNILSNNYLKEVCFAYAYIIHPPLDTKHHSYDSIMFKIAQNKAWNLTRINNAAGAFQNNTFFMFQNNTLVSRALDYSLFDYAPIHTHTHTARIRENVHIVKGNIINERKNET